MNWSRSPVPEGQFQRGHLDAGPGTFQFELGHFRRPRAAQAFHKYKPQAHWDHAFGRNVLKGEEPPHRRNAIRGLDRDPPCVGVVDGCLHLLEGSALYETSPLQRRLRDLQRRGPARHRAAKRSMPVWVANLTFTTFSLTTGLTSAARRLEIGATPAPSRVISGNASRTTPARSCHGDRQAAFLIDELSSEARAVLDDIRRTRQPDFGHQLIWRGAGPRSQSASPDLGERRRT